MTWYVIGQAELVIILGSFSFGLGDLNLVDLLEKVPNRNQMLNLTNLYKIECMKHYTKYKKVNDFMLVQNSV